MNRGHRKSIDDGNIMLSSSPNNNKSTLSSIQLLTPNMLVPLSKEYQKRNRSRTKSELKQLPPLSAFAPPSAHPNIINNSNNEYESIINSDSNAFGSES